MELALLHVGLMKTATSYLQTVWSRQPEVALARSGSFGIMNAFRKAILNGELNPKANLDIKTDQDLLEGQKIVISNEGFSTAFLNGDRASQEKVGAYIEYCGAMLGRLLPDLNNVLIVVRDPISWIRSIHVQSIKEGGFLSASEFVQKQASYLLHSLDLRLIVQSYRSQFENTRVLHYELLRSNETAFWETLRDWFGLPVPRVPVEDQNKSPSQFDTQLLARLNRIGGCLMSGLVSVDPYPFPDERNKLIDAYSGSAIWVNRRFVEYAEDASKVAVAESLGLSGVDPSFFDFELPSELKEKLERDFIGFLEQVDGFDSSVLQSYRSSLSLTA